MCLRALLVAPRRRAVPRVPAISQVEQTPHRQPPINLEKGMWPVLCKCICISSSLCDLGAHDVSAVLLPGSTPLGL